MTTLRQKLVVRSSLTDSTLLYEVSVSHISQPWQKKADIEQTFYLHFESLIIYGQLQSLFSLVLLGRVRPGRLSRKPSQALRLPIAEC